jgi:hypothetical protein
MQLFHVCRYPAAGFLALASVHHAPIPDARGVQQKPGGSKQPRKRPHKVGQNGNKRGENDQNDSKLCEDERNDNNR